MAKGDAAKNWKAWTDRYGKRSELLMGRDAIQQHMSQSMGMSAPPQFANENQPDDNSIFIFGIIGEQFWYDSSTQSITAVSSDRVVEALERIGQGKAKVYINSAGGILDEGITIYNMIRKYDAQTFVVGMAGSAASVIALGGKGGCNFMEGSSFFIHKAWGFAQGNDDELRAVADRMQAGNEKMLSIYENVSGLSNAVLLEYMVEETEFTASKAAELGFGKIYNGDVSANGNTSKEARAETSNAIHATEYEINGDIQQAIILNGGHYAVTI